MRKILIFGLVLILALSTLMFVTSCDGNGAGGAEVVVSTMAGGDSFSLIVRDGFIYAAGIARGGQLGFESSEHIFELTRVEDISNVVGVAAGYGHALAVTEDGYVYSWGRNDRGQLGIGSRETKHVPTRVELDLKAVSVAAGGNISFAIMEDGTVRGWGMNDDGHVGNGEGETGLNAYTPAVVVNVSNVVEVAVGHDHAAARIANGDVFVWGYNEMGQAGNGDEEDVIIPEKVEGLPSKAVSIAANRFNTIIALEDGGVFATGGGVDEEEGLYFSFNETSTQSHRFIKMTGFSEIVQVSATADSILAIDEHGKMWAVGANSSGNLGLGDTDDRIAPYVIEELDSVLELAGGDWHVLILRENGNVYGMGATQFGQLAQGTENRSRVVSPTLIVE